MITEAVAIKKTIATKQTMVNENTIKISKRKNEYEWRCCPIYIDQNIGNFTGQRLDIDHSTKKSFKVITEV